MNYNNRLNAESFNYNTEYQEEMNTHRFQINHYFNNYLNNYSNNWINQIYEKTSNKLPLSKDCSNLSYTPGCYAKQDLFKLKPLKIKYAKSDMFKSVADIKASINRSSKNKSICPVATSLIRELLQCNIIKKATDMNHKLIVNPVYFKQKKPGKISIIYDGINSNRIIKNYVDFEIPHVYHILNDLKLFKHPTRVDINNAYFNTPVSNKSKKLLGFVINNEIYYWNCLPFGIANAPNLFIHATDNIIKTISDNNNGLLFRKYFDDIIIEKEDKEIWVKELKIYNVSVKDEGDTKFLGYEYRDRVLSLPKERYNIIFSDPPDNKSIAYLSMQLKIDAINHGCYVKPREIHHNWKYYLNPDFKRFLKYHYNLVNPHFTHYIYTIICLIKKKISPFRLCDLISLRDYLNVYKIRRLLARERPKISSVQTKRPPEKN